MVQLAEVLSHIITPHTTHHITTPHTTHHITTPHTSHHQPTLSSPTSPTLWCKLMQWLNNFCAERAILLPKVQDLDHPWLHKARKTHTYYVCNRTTYITNMNLLQFNPCIQTYICLNRGPGPLFCFSLFLTLPGFDPGYYTKTQI